MQAPLSFLGVRQLRMKSYRKVGFSAEIELGHIPIILFLRRNPPEHVEPLKSKGAERGFSSSPGVWRYLRALS